MESCGTSKKVTLRSSIEQGSPGATAFAHQSSDAASVVGVSVGQQDGVYVGQVPAYTAEEGTYVPGREAGVDEETARVRFHVGCIARATARKNTQPQIRPLSGWAFDQRERNPFRS